MGTCKRHGKWVVGELERALDLKIVSTRKVQNTRHFNYHEENDFPFLSSEAKGEGWVRNGINWSFLLSVDALFYKSMFLCFLFYKLRYHFFFTGQQNQSKHKQTTACASI